MSKDKFTPGERYLLDLVAGGVPLRPSSGRIHEKEVVVIANLIVNCSAELLANPHDQAHCDNCLGAVILHPATIKQVPQAKILCGECASRLKIKPEEALFNPDAIAEMLGRRKK